MPHGLGRKRFVADPKQESCPAWRGPDWRDEAQEKTTCEERGHL